ncbi:hypothetical protein [Herbaspirillum seropedicae]|uniref:hypothetical protein n=1 Tax=Herbaspirillum seropedicae TaxID=964 RepID=UPI00339B0ECC
MTTTVLKLSESSAFLKTISLKSIKDVRALDVDLLLVLTNGDQILISGGAMHALNSPDMALQFSDGQLPLARVFEQIERINVSPEANLTVSSKEITRYNQNNARKKKARQQDEEGDKPIISPDDEKDPVAATETNGTGGNTNSTDYSPIRSTDNRKQLAEAEISSEKEKSWGVQWPIAAGVLAVLAAAGGGGGGGGAGAAGASTAGGGGSGAASVEPPKANLEGAVVLGAIRNATITAYDNAGNALSAATEVVDGKYALVLTRPFYKGPMLLVVRDNTPEVADNYIDEATQTITNLGATPLRALVEANGVNQTVNVTALTELAVQKAGLAAGVTTLAGAPEVTTERINSANAAVGAFFKVDAIAGEVVPTHIANSQGVGVVNPAYNAAISAGAQNYGAALKALANLVLLDDRTYPNQAAVLQKLAEALVFVDEARSALKWATTAQGEPLAAAAAIQAALFSEALQQTMADLNNSETTRAQASVKLAKLQKLPTGTTVADYLVKNHVAIANPVIEINQGLPGQERQWELPSFNTLKLDQGDFMEGGMRVPVPPFAQVVVTIIGRDIHGTEIIVTLPKVTADASGNAVLNASEPNIEELFRMDAGVPVSARITVTDGYNVRSNGSLWKSQSDVRVDLNTPPDLTNFVNDKPIALGQDSYYHNVDGDTHPYPTKNGDKDGVTNSKQIKVSLTKALNATGEALQFAVATKADLNGKPIFGVWNTVTSLGTPTPIQGGRGAVSYTVDAPLQQDGPTWIKARVVQIGNGFTGGQGNANTANTVLEFNLDTTKPPKMKLNMAGGADNGISNNDDISHTRNPELILAGAQEGSTEIHYRLLTGNGTKPNSLKVKNAANPDGTPVPTGIWAILRPGDRLEMKGDSKDGNGKVRLQVRQIDQAGNFSDNTQSFVVDTTGVIQHAVRLTQRRTLLAEAENRLNLAKTAEERADAANLAARQTDKATAQLAVQSASASLEQAMDDARKALKGEGVSKFDELLSGASTTVPPEYVPAMVNHLSTLSDAEQVNESTALAAEIGKARRKADDALRKVSEYGDPGKETAPNYQDFFDMGILNLSRDAQEQAAQLSAINSALRKLPADKSDSITKVQAATDAYLKVLKLANTRDDTATADLPTLAEYAALGVEPPLTEAGAKILGGAIDRKTAGEVAPITELDGMAAAANRIAQRAGQPAGQTAGAAPTVADFTDLKFDGVIADNLNDVVDQLNNVPPALRSLSLPAADRVIDQIDTWAEVQALVKHVVGPLTILINYANGKVPIDEQNPAQTEPFVSNYRNALLNGDTAVDASNLAAINSALREVKGPKINSWPRLATLVGSYNHILALADGVAGNARELPTAEDYRNIGVQDLDKSAAENASPATRNNAVNNTVKLLNDALDSADASRSQIDRVDKVKKLADIAARVILLAGQDADATNAASFKAEELNQLHLAHPLTAAQIELARWGVAGSQNDGNDVATREQLDNVIQKAITASAKIRAYADNTTAPTPTLSDYRDLGIRGMTDEQQAQAINSSLATTAITGNNVADPGKLQIIATAWQTLLKHPGNSSDAVPGPTIATYETVGAQQPTDTNTLTLLNSALKGKQPSDIATVDKLNTFTNAANTVRAVAGWDDETAKNTATDAWITGFKDMLARLGVQNLHDESQRAILAVIRLGSDDGAEIDTLFKLQEIARKAHTAQLKVNAYADNNAGSLTTGDYHDMGVKDVNDSNIASINSALASGPVNSNNTKTPEKVQEIVVSYGRILAAANSAADDNASSLTKLDYTNVGVAPTVFEGSDDGAAVLAVLNSLVDASPNSRVELVSKLDLLATTAAHVMAQVRGKLEDKFVSKQELTAAGIERLDDLTFNAVLAALADSADDGSAVAGTTNGKLKLQDLADKAHQAQQQLIDYANNTPRTPTPTLTTYKQVGLDLAQKLDNAETPTKAVEALNSALRTPAVTGEKVNTPAKLLTLIDAYKAILAAADGNANPDDTLSTAAAAISVEQLTTLGLTGLDASTPASLLNYVRAWLDAMPKATAQDVANIQKGIDVLRAIHELADGTRNTTTLGTAAPFGPTPDDLLKALAAVGVSVTDATLANAALTAIDAVQFASISSPRKLKTLIDTYQRILAEANEAEGSNGTTNNVPDATPDADPSAEDFTRLGISIPGVNMGTPEPARLKLLDDALKYKPRSHVDDVTEISAIGEAVAFFMDIAAQPAGSLPPTLTDEVRTNWEQQGKRLGITGIASGLVIDENGERDSNLDDIFNALRGKPAADIDSVAKLQAIINKLNESLIAIGDYADDNSKPAPTVQTYRDAGIVNSGGAALVTDANLRYINAAVDVLTRDDVSTRSKIKNVVRSYLAILEAADGSAENAALAAALKADQYVKIGVALSHTSIGIVKITSPTTQQSDPDKLGLLNSIVGLRTDDEVGTPAKITDLAKTAADLIRLAKEDASDVVKSFNTHLSRSNLVKAGLTIKDETHRKAFLDAVQFKGNAIDTTTGVPRSDDTPATHKVSDLNTIEQLQSIADAYGKVLAHANGGSAAAPTDADYAMIGIALPKTSPETKRTHALSLLNGVVKALSTEKIDTVAELNKLAITVDKLMQLAAVGEIPDSHPKKYEEVPTNLRLSLQELTDLGLTGITNDNQVAVLLHKVQTTVNDGTGIASLTDLQTLATAAITAQEKIRLYAETNSGPVPTEDDFRAIGLELPKRGNPEISDDYLTVVNDALQSGPVTGAKAASAVLLQKIITAAQHVVNAADGGSVTAVPKPTRADFEALGLEPSKLDAAGTAGIAFLGEIIDASTIGKLTKDDENRPITIPAKLADLLDAIQALMDTVAGRTDTELTQKLLEKLEVKFNGVEKNADNAIINWAAIRSAIAGSRPDGSDVNSLNKLQKLVGNADAAQRKIRLYAERNDADSSAANTPTTEDYFNIGLVGPALADPTQARPKLVTADLLAPVNAALQTIAIDKDRANTPELIKKIVVAYDAILNRANGDLPDTDIPALQAQHFKDIGADIPGVTTDTTNGTDTAVRALLDSIISSKAKTDVDTPSKIDTLGRLVNKVIALAHSDPNDDGTIVNTLSPADLIALGIQSGNAAAPALDALVHAAALPAAFYAIAASANTGAEVDSKSELQKVVTDAINAYKKIIAYAELTDEPRDFLTDANRPTAADFKAMGLIVPALVKQDDAIGVAASLATASITKTSIDTMPKLTTLLNHWQTLLALADGATNRDTDADRANFKPLLTDLGLDLPAATSDQALNLLQSALDALDARTNTSAINTPKKLLALLDTTQAIIDLAGHPKAYAAADLTDSSANKLSKAKLTALGVLPAGAEDGVGASVLSALAAKASVAELDSMTKITAIVRTAIASHNKITAHAQDAASPAPDANDYLNIGLVKNDRSPLVTVNNLGAINSTLASTPIDQAKAGDPALIKGIIDAYQHVIDWKQSSTSIAPTLADYHTLGLDQGTDKVTAANKPLLDSALKEKLSLDAIKDHAKLSAAATIAARITTMADGAANTLDANLPDANAYAALGLSMGNAASDRDPDGSAAALLGSVIDRKSAADVDTVAEVQALLDTVNKLMDSAAQPDTAAVPTVDDLRLLGIDIGNLNEHQQQAILHAIGTSGPNGQKIKSVDALGELRGNAIAALQKIQNYAESNSTEAADIPTLDHYKQIGVRKIDADEVNAINAVLATAFVTGNKADSWLEVQEITNIYDKIHAAANGKRADTDPVNSTALPTQAELEKIGVNLSHAPVDEHHLNLLTTALDAVNWDKVDTPAEIEAIHASAGRVLAGAGNAAAAASITLDDLKNLGINGVEDESTMTNVRTLISEATTTAAAINTSTRLQGLIDGLLKDIKLIRNYATNTPTRLENGTETVVVPAVENYTRPGVNHVTTANLDSINAAVKALADADAVGSKSKLQDIVDAYKRILEAADGTPGNLPGAPISRDELIRIGVSKTGLPNPDDANLTDAQKKHAQALLGLLSSALDAQPINKSTVDTPAKIDVLVALAKKVADHAATPASATSAQAPTRTDLETLGVKQILEQDGATPGTLTLINSALQGYPAEQLGQLKLKQVQTIATAAAKLRQLTSTDRSPEPGDHLTYDELTALRLTVDNSPANIKLLNEALDRLPSFAAVSTVTALQAQKLDDLVNRVMRQADADLKANANAPAIIIEIDEWTKLGLSIDGASADVDSASQSAFMAAIRFKSPDDLDTLAKLKRVAQNARDAHRKIVKYAKDVSNGEVGAEDSLPALPTQADFEAMGVTGSAQHATATGDRTDGMSQSRFAVLSSLATAKVGESQTATAKDVQEIVDIYNKVLALADGMSNNINPDATARITVTVNDYKKLGIDLPQGFADQPAKLSLLNSVIDKLATDKVNTPKEITDLMKVVAKVIAHVNSDGAQAPSKEDLTLIGVTGLTDEDLPAVLFKLQKTTTLDKVDTLDKLQTLSTNAIAAQQKIRDYAGNSALSAPIATDYENIAVTLPTEPAAVGRVILAALNSALASTPVGRLQAGTPQDVQNIVNSYAKLLGIADGNSNTAAGNLPSANDYKNVGLETALLTQLKADANPATAAAKLRLLNDLVDRAANPTAIATPAQLDTLATLSGKLIDQAAATVTDGQPDHLSVDELSQLGIHAGDRGQSALTLPNNLKAASAALYAIRASSNDGAQVDTIAELQALVSKAMRAFEKVEAYAKLSPAPANFPNDADRPTAADLKDIGLTVTGGVLADNAVSVAASLLSTNINAAQVATAADIQKLANNWNTLFTLANGRPDTAALTDLTRPGFKTLLTEVGVTVAAGHSNDALNLLHSSLDRQGNHTLINGPAKLLALLETAQAITALAGAPKAYEQSEVTGALSVEKLANLGVMPAGSTAPEAAPAAAAVLSALAAKANAAAVSDLGSVITTANLARTAQAKIALYAKTNSGAEPTATDYAQIGLVKDNPERTPLVNDNNLAAVNSALASTTIDEALANTPNRLKTIIDAYDKILAWKTDNGVTISKVPSATDYSHIGVTGVTAENKVLLDSVVVKLDTTKVQKHADLQASADVVVKIKQMANSANDTLVADLPTLANYQALGLDLGRAVASGPQGSALALINNAIDNKGWTGVNTFDLLQNLINSANKLMASAANEAGALPPTADDFSILGVDISLKTAPQQVAILAAVATSGTDGQNLKSIANLKTLVNKAVESLAKIETYAGDNTGAAKGVPGAEDYQAIGVPGVNTNNLAAVNAALATDKVGKMQAGTQPEIKGIVDAYLKILALADGSRLSTDPVGTDKVPSLAELERIGVSVTSNTNPNQLSLLATAIDAVSNDKVDTPAKINTISASADKFIKAIGKNTAEATLLTLTDYQNLGVTGLTADKLTSANDLIRVSTVDRINSSAKLQNVIDALPRDIKIIRNYATNTPNDDANLGRLGEVLVPTVRNYEGTGVNGVNEGNRSSINAAVRALGVAGKTGNVSSQSELQKIVNAYKHILDAADGVAGNLGANPITRDELLAIGIPEAKLINPAQLGLDARAIQQAQASLALISSSIDAQPNDKSTVNTPALIVQLVDIANKVAAHAARTSSSAGPENPPTQAQLEKLAVKHILPDAGPATPSTLELINSTLKNYPEGSLAALDLAKLQVIATAAAKLRNLASGSGVVTDASRPTASEVTTDGSPKPGAPLTHTELTALRLTVADQADHIKLLNDALDARTNFESVSTQEKLAALNLDKIVTRVMQQADADVPPPPAPISISLADWHQLGVKELEVTPTTTTLLNDNAAEALLFLLPSRDKDQVNTLEKLKTIGLKAQRALDKISLFAKNRTDDIVPPAGGTEVPTLQDFRDIGVSGVDSKPQGLTALLSSLATRAIDDTKADTRLKIQTIVDSYNKLLVMANGVSDTSEASKLPSADDYKNVGLATDLVTQLQADATRPHAATKLRLLNDLVDRAANPEAIATPVQLAALATLAGKLVNLAAQDAGDAVVSGAELADAEYTLLALGSPTASKKAAILSALQAKSPADVNMMSAVQQIAWEAIAAIDKIIRYADTNTGDAPAVVDYERIGIDSFSGSTPTGDRNAVNAALATANVIGTPTGTPNEKAVNTPAKLRGLIASYGKVLAQADGTPDNTTETNLAKQSDFEAIGVNLTGLTGLDSTRPAVVTNAVSLLNSIIDSRHAADVDTPAEIETYIGVVQKIAHTVKGTDTGANILTENDITHLGIAGATSGNIAAIRQALAALEDDGSQSNTLKKIDDLVLSIAIAPTLNVVAGDDTINKNEYDGTLTLSGTTGKGSTVTLQFANGRSVNATVQSSSDARVSRVDWSYTLTTDDKTALRDGKSAIQVNPDLRVESVHAARNVHSAVLTRNLSIDLVPPALPTVTLEDDTGSGPHDKTTNIGNVKVEGIEAGATWQWTIDNGRNWSTSSSDTSATIALTGDGAKSFKVKVTDRAGNTTEKVKVTNNSGVFVEADALNFTLDKTNPTKAVFSNAGFKTINGVKYSKNTVITIDSGLDASAPVRQFKVGRGDWTDITGNAFSLPDTSDGEKTVQVRQIDLAGNESLSDTLTFTLDATKPAAPTVSLEEDTGRDSSDKITKNGKIRVEGIEAGATWQWSADNGVTWSTERSDSSATIDVTGDGDKTFKVKVTDQVGNVTETVKVSNNRGGLDEVGAFTFKLDTTVNYLSVQTPSQQRTPQGGSDTFRYSGSGAEPNASVSLKIIPTGKNLDDAFTLGTTTAASDGTWKIDIKGILRITGLRQVDGRDSNANGVYTLLSLNEVKALPRFSSDFATEGRPLLDTSKEVYRMVRGGATWYIWAPLNGGFIISRDSGSDEWYQQPIAHGDYGTQAANRVTSWHANSATANQLQVQQLLGNGSSPNSRLLGGVEIISAHANASPDFRYYLQQTDVAGNVTIDRTGLGLINTGRSQTTIAPLAADLDRNTKGVQTSQLHVKSYAELLARGGVTIARDTDVDLTNESVDNISNFISIIRVTFGGDGLDVARDRLVLHEERPLDQSFTDQNVSLGESLNLELRYDAQTKTLEIEDKVFVPRIDAIIRSIRLHNPGFTEGERTMTITLVDGAGRESLPSTATISVTSPFMWLDLDPNTAETQFNSTNYLRSAASLVNGVAFDSQIAAPYNTVRGLEVKLSGAGLDVVNDKLKLDVSLNLNADSRYQIGKVLGNITGLGYEYTADTRTLRIVDTTGLGLNDTKIQAIVESLALSNPAAKDGERVAELLVFRTDGSKGPVSTARIILDTVAPVLDLDAGVAGVQTSSAKSAVLASVAAGTGLFGKPIAVAAATDIDLIRLDYTGRTSELLKDFLSTASLLPAVALPLGATGRGNIDISGVSRLKYALSSPGSVSKRIEFSKESGEAITSIEAKTILEALRFKTTSTDTTSRRFDVVLVDKAGNASALVQSTLSIDTRTPPTLSMTKLEEGNQISFGMLTLNTDLGNDVNTGNLKKGESVALTLPAEFTPTSFLSALKAISSDWGGPGISGSSSVIEDRYRSYTSVAAPSTLTSSFSMAHQSHSSVKGNQVQFSIAGNTLSFINNGGFAVLDSDIYRFTRFNGESKDLTGGYDMGNLRLLYQTTTANVNSTPTFAVSYDRARVAVGDVIGLYEGNKLLASKTLESADVGGTGTATLNLKISDSLAPGNHAIVSKYTSATGLTSQSTATTVNITGDAKTPLLTDLKVKAGYGEESTAKAILLGGDAYTSITDPGRVGTEGTYDKGLIFSGSVNTPGLTGPQKYLVTVSLGGKLLGYDTFTLSTTDDPATSKFTLQAASNLLAPGLYRDLTATVTNVTEGSIHNGQTSVIKDASLGWYWVGQGMGNLIGGQGNDGMLLGASQTTSPFTVTTGAGAGTLTLGAFGKSSNLTATVTDFQLGLDKVQVWGQSITSANLSSFASATASDNGRSTTLTVDLDGVRGGLSYTLQLQNVAFNAANTQTIFGV